jgi:hypothetical protein
MVLYDENDAQGQFGFDFSTCKRISSSGITKSA